MRITALIASAGIHLVITGAALSLSARQAPKHSTAAIQIVRVTPPKPPPPRVETPKEPPPRRAPGPSEPRAPAPVETKAARPSSGPGEQEAPAFDSHLTLGNSAPGGGLEVPTAAPEKRRREEPRPQPEETKKLSRSAPASAECDEAPTKPRPIDRPTAIEYSAKARAEGVEGRLVLKITVGADGHVATVEVTSSVDPALDEAAIEAVKSWRFEPGRRCGKPTSATYTLARRFELGD
jgi:protein TonB